MSAIRTVAWLGLDSLCFCLRPRKRLVTLVLRLDAIGDFFIWMQSGAVDVAELAREGDRRSVLLANHTWAAYARDSSMWDEVIAVNPAWLMRNPVYRLRLMWQVRRQGASLLIQPRHARVFLQEDAIARVSGAGRRIGSAGTFLNMTPRLHRWGNRFYDELVEVDESRELHETMRNSHFVRSLLGRTATAFRFPPSQSKIQTYTITVAVGAGQVGRMWPIEKLVGLLRHIRRMRPAADIKLVGSSTENSRAEHITACVEGVTNLVGRTSLAELVSLIASSRLVVCNDTSAYHIATAVDTDVLCFLGGGHFGWYAPYPGSMTRKACAKVLFFQMDCFWCNWRCRFPRAEGGALRCVASIGVDTAIDAVNSLLAAP